MQHHRDIPLAPTLAEVRQGLLSTSNLCKTFEGNKQAFNTDYIYANLFENPFPQDTTVKNIILRNYKFDSNTDCAHQLAELMKNQSITMLIIRQCAFNDDMAFAFAKELAKGEHSLVCLDFDGCTGISDAGLNALMEATANQWHFKELSAGMCEEVSDAGHESMRRYKNGKREISKLSLLAASVIANNPLLYAKSKEQGILPEEAKTLIMTAGSLEQEPATAPQQTNQEENLSKKHDAAKRQVEHSQTTQAVSSSSSSFFNIARNGIIIAIAAIGLTSVVSKNNTPGS